MVEPLPVISLQRINAACEDFERAWRENSPLDIESTLNRVSELERSELLSELLLLDVYYRRRNGETPSAENYVKRFPEQTDVVTETFCRRIPAAETEDEQITGPGRLVQEYTPGYQIDRFLVDRRLGSGTFGVVYLVNDPTTKESFALKLFRQSKIESGRRQQSSLDEAIAISQLAHPGIVQLIEVGSHEGMPFIVLEYVDGHTLGELFRSKALSVRQMVSLIAEVADTINFVHRHDYYHRDLKPENIIVGHDGRPRILDFGLAIQESTRRDRSGEVVGTVHYMSPEQILGENHRLDGRTDIWALGVILYRALTGRRPFDGNTPDQLEAEILNPHPRPPRQIVEHDVSRELEDICLKALSRHPGDRFATAQDMADDLRQALAGESVHQAVGTTVPVISRGLHPFECGDSAFFHKLLPGPRHISGLPESIHFWKTRVEAMRPGDAFPAGVIFGPSGSGKTSFVKAGLLPTLAERVLPIYVPVEADGIENQLLSAIRASIPNVPASFSLPQAIQDLRERRTIHRPGKVLLVLDQFERWLHDREPHGDSVLARALRQCDGVRVQCLLVLRAEFWLSITDFMRVLDIRLQCQINQLDVPPFDAEHAAHVLAHFAPDSGHPSPDRTREQADFIQRAVAELATDGVVLPVQLSLLTEIMKHERWTPATLQRLGGATGVGTELLNRTFSAVSGKPEHLRHEDAAIAVLRALLPDLARPQQSFSRSRSELLDLSGYQSCPAEFEILIDILTAELRLVKPIDRSVAVVHDQQSTEPSPSANGHYQLAHDFIIPSVRQWLELKDNRTRRGRAQRNLTDRARLWNARREKQQLPGFVEWISVLWFTRRAVRTDAQRKMMKAAGSHYRTRIAVLAGAVLVVIVSFVAAANYRYGLQDRNRDFANTLINSLLQTEFRQLPEVIDRIETAGEWTLPALVASLDGLTESDNEAELRCRLALLRFDPDQTEFVCDRLLTEPPDRVETICRILSDAPESLAVDTARRFFRLRLESTNREDSEVLRLWPNPSRETVSLIKDAHGSVFPQFAFCQTMTVNTYDHIADDMSQAHYRPIRFRPWLSGGMVNTAVLWVRDAAQSRVERGLSAQALLQRDAQLQQQGLRLIDLVAYIGADESARSKVTFAGVWSGSYHASETRILINSDQSGYSRESADPAKAGYRPVSHSRVCTADGLQVWTGLWKRSAVTSRIDPAWRIVDEVHPDYFGDVRGLVDMIIYPSATDAVDIRRRFGEQQTLAETILQHDPHDPAGIFLRGRASYYLGDVVSADDDLTRVIEESPKLSAYALPLRALAKARQNNAADTRDDLNRLQSLLGDLGANRNWASAYLSSLHAKSLACLGRAKQGFERLELILNQQPGNSELLFYAACAYSSVASFLAQTDGEQSEHYKDIALELLERAHAAGFSGDFRLQATTDLACVRTDPRFSELLQSKKCYLYAGVWCGNDDSVSKVLFGLDPATHRGKCLSLARDGYSPVILSVIQTDSDSAPQAVSVWRREPVTEEQVVNSARLANSAAALLRLDRTSDVWGLLEQSAGPQIRPELIRRLSAFGVDPDIVHDKAMAEQADVSVRRTLILALGDYEHQSPGTVRPETARQLIELYRQHRDPGIHSAVAWLLRICGRESQIAEVDQEFMNQSHKTDRVPSGWNVNSQGHTMVVIPGPVEFEMGSPEAEMNRGSNEPLHQQQIDWSFEISSTEVTNRQCQRMSSDVNHDESDVEPDAPASVSWYRAAEYCNWLSERQSIPKDQWCYLPNDHGDYASGMRVPADSQTRQGYRLPTEAEWEYSCRAGTRRTAWSHGSMNLLDRYAWYYSNAGQRAHPVGMLRPNDWGLFDMHGNAQEWCSDADPRSFTQRVRADVRAARTSS